MDIKDFTIPDGYSLLNDSATEGSCHSSRVKHCTIQNLSARQSIANLVSGLERADTLV